MYKPPFVNEYDIELAEAARKNPDGWFDSMDTKTLATLCRYAATLAFLGIERNVLHNAGVLLDRDQVAEARTLIAFRAKAIDLLLDNLPQYGANMVDLSTVREWWPLMEKARLSMAQAGIPDAFDEPKEKRECK